jgi:hypothetical protein
MDNHQPKVDKVPHSNSANVPEALRETPVEEFDMTLQEAHDAGKVSTLPLTEAPEPNYNFVPPTETPEVRTSAEAPKNKKSLAVKIGVAAAGLAVAAGAVFGVKAVTDNANEAPVKNPDDTTQVEEGNEQPPVVEEEPPVVNEMEQILNQEKPARFDELEAMTLDEFKLQPIADRVNYYGYLNRDAKHLAELWYEESDNPRDLIAINMTVNPENTGDEILASTQLGLRGAMTRHFEEYDLEEVPLYTPEQREKMAASLYLNPDNPIAIKWRTAVADETINGYVPGFYVKNNILLADDEVLSRTETTTYTDQNGVEHPATDITLRDETGQVATATHVLIQTESVSQWVVAG